MTSADTSARLVVERYESAYPDPIRVAEGEPVTVERRETEWDGWLWATDGSGREGWIPEAFVEPRSNTWISAREYVARELSVFPGTLLTSLETVGGWEWCETPSGEAGWVPSRNLVPAEPDAEML
jgi:hypothetical protein